MRGCFLEQGFGGAAGFSGFVDEPVQTKAAGGQLVSPIDFVTDSDLRSRGFLKVTMYDEFIVKGVGLVILDIDFQYREEKTFRFKLAVWNPDFRQHFHAGLFEKRDIVLMMDESHHVGFHVTNADAGPGMNHAMKVLF